MVYQHAARDRRAVWFFEVLLRCQIHKLLKAQCYKSPAAPVFAVRYAAQAISSRRTDLHAEN